MFYLALFMVVFVRIQNTIEYLIGDYELAFSQRVGYIERVLSGEQLHDNHDNSDASDIHKASDVEEDDGNVNAMFTLRSDKDVETIIEEDEVDSEG